jgi:putative ABC transport system permease protein
MTDLFQDIRYALRMLGKSPVLTAIVILTLALGIGANTAIFGIIQGLLLRPLPVPNPDRITIFAGHLPGDTIGVTTLSYAHVEDLRKQATDFSDIFAWQIDIGGLSVDQNAHQFVYSTVTGNYFTGLGVKPALGRLFVPSEGEKGGRDPYVVLGYSYWQSTLGGDPSIVGKHALLNGQPVTIIGVTPQDFYGTGFGMNFDGYVPLNLNVPDATMPLWTDRAARGLIVLGRLKPGATLKQARASVNAIAARMSQEYPATDRDAGIEVTEERFSRPEPHVATMIPFISGIFLLLAAMVLVLACTNVANILLVRATMREREMAIRAAMGAGRARLIGQMLTESIVLAILGAAGGLLVARWATWIVSGMLPPMKLPIRLDINFDWSIFAYAMGAATVTGILVGMWPAIRAGRTDVNSVLHGAGRSDTAGVGRHRVRSALVVLQVCGSLVLLIVAGLFVRTLTHAQHAYMGFDPDNVLNVSLDPTQVGYDETRTKSFYHDLKARLRALPGVESVAETTSVPLGTVNGGAMVYVEGRQVDATHTAPVIMTGSVDPDYFTTLRVPVLRGRTFTEQDDEHAPLVAVVNQAMARDLWPGEGAIGKRFSAKGPQGPFMEVVGLAGDGKYTFMGYDHERFFYVPMLQDPNAFRTLQVRSTLPPDTLENEVQAQVRALDANLPIIDIETMRQSLTGPNGTFVFRVGALVAAAIGVLGLILAMVGVYGVVSFAASQRTHEIGIRLALGANGRDILKIVLQQGIVLVGVGVGAGLVLALLLTRTMATLLVGVSPTDAVTFVSATVMLAAIGAWACYAPARRAMKLDPVVALRHE